MNKNLTEGNPGKVLIGFTIPLFVSVVFQQIYSISDSIIAGRYAGEDALAAVGASYPITMIFMAVAVGFQIGCSVVISKIFGSGNQSRTRSCITTALISGLAVSAIMTAAGIFLSNRLLKIINTPDNIFESGNMYLKIYTGGFIFVFIYNVATGVFNSLGDSKTPLYLLIGSSISNILLDLLFVAVFGWGVAGAAWATFIAQGAACILTMPIIFKRIKSLASGHKDVLFSFENFRTILFVAVPSILQQSFVSVGNLFIQSMVNNFGSSVMAGYSSAIKLNTFSITSFATIGNGISSFTAQNIGAGKTKRIKKGLKAGMIFSLTVSLLFFILYFSLSNFLVGMFLKEKDSTPLAIDTGIKFLRIVSPFYFLVSAKLTCDGVLRGAERMKSFMAATFTDLILRVILAFIFSNMWNQTGIWIAWPFSWLIATAMSVFFCVLTFKTINKENKIIKASDITPE